MKDFLIANGLAHEYTLFDAIHVSINPYRGPSDTVTINGVVYSLYIRSWISRSLMKAIAPTIGAAAATRLREEVQKAGFKLDSLIMLGVEYA